MGVNSDLRELASALHRDVEVIATVCAQFGPDCTHLTQLCRLAITTALNSYSP